MLNVFKKYFSARSNIFLVCLILFIVGIAVGNFFVWDNFITLCLVLALIISLIFIWPNRALRVIILLIIFFILGILRLQVNASDCAGRHDLICHYNNQTKFVARVVNTKEDIGRQQLQLYATGVVFENKIYPVRGNVLINQSLYPKYDYGDVLVVNCPLGLPKPTEDFDYGKYLATKRIYTICPYGDISKISAGAGNPAVAAIFKIKDALSTSLKNSVSEPQSSILRAMIINETGGIPDSWNETFSNLGLTHIIAISGSHITIIVSLIMFLAIALGLARPKAFWVALTGIIIYVIMIGFPASAVRAAIMGILVVYAQKIGRMSSAENLIVLSAAAMLAINPLLLIYDVGFQLSFLAVIGLVYLGPIVEHWLKRVPQYFQLREMLTATFAAQLMTLPLLVYQFGRFAPISILANILILPIIPFLTVFVLLNAVVGAIIPPLGMLMGWVSWLFTSYWLWISALMQKINFFSLSFKITWLGILVFYILIGALIFRFRKESINL